MKLDELTPKQQEILKEIHEMVLSGHEKLQKFQDQSAAMDEKWQKIAEAKHAQAKQ